MSLRRAHVGFLDLVAHHGHGDVVLISCQTPCASLTLSNPTKRNAISGRMMNQLVDAIDTLLGMPQPPLAILLRAEACSNTFCSGADLDLVRSVVNTPKRGLAMSACMTDAFTKLRASGVLSVAVLNGSAIGGGSELATVADFRVMAPQHHIRFLHASIGASPGWGGAHRLVSIVGRRHALRLLGTSPKVGAMEARRMGLVDRVVAGGGDALDAAAMDVLSPYLALRFPASVRAAKRMVGAHDYEGQGECRALERQCFGERWGSRDNAAALRKE